MNPRIFIEEEELDIPLRGKPEWTPKPPTPEEVIENETMEYLNNKHGFWPRYFLTPLGILHVEQHRRRWRTKWINVEIWPVEQTNEDEQRKTSP